MTLILEMILTTAASVFIVCAGVALWDAIRDRHNRLNDWDHPRQATSDRSRRG